MIYDYLSITSRGDSIWDFCDLMGIIVLGNNVQGFDTKWDEVLLSTKKILEDGTLELFLQNETQRFKTIEVYLGSLHARYHAKREETSNTRLKDMARRLLDQKIKDRNFDASRTDKTAQGAALKRREMANVAVAKQNKETALNGPLKDNVRKVTRAALSTMNIQQERAGRKTSNTISFTRLNQIFQRGRQRCQGQGTKIQQQRPASLLQVHAGEMSDNYQTKEGCRFGDKCSFMNNEDRNSQGKMQKKDSKPDNATTTLVKDIGKLDVFLEEQKFYVNQRMDLPT